MGHRHDHAHHHDHHHAHGHDHARDKLGNPSDLAAYLERLEGADRAAWQKPDDVVEALRLHPGDVACDLGCGPGYFTLRLARAVGPMGRVHALDAEPRMLELLRTRAGEAGMAHVHAHQATVPPEPVDCVLIVNAYHHFPDGPGTLRALASRLKEGGRIVNVDFHGGDLPIGPPPDHRVSRARFLEDVAAAGLRVDREEAFLQHQYFLVLTR